MHKHDLLRHSLFLAVLITLSFSCRSSPTGPHVTQNVQLSADYVTCTEVWLKIGFTDSPNGGEYKITRDSATVLRGSFSGLDTVIIDTTTQAQKTYTYKAYKLTNGQVSEIGLPLQVTTLDSTSNNFTWQTFTFGGTAGGSMLGDVAIINDTDIWAVGEIAVKDSSVNGYSVYNAVHWDGQGWSVEKIPYVYQGQPLYHPIECVFALNTNDVWFGGNGLEHWDGSQFANEEAVNPFWSGHLMKKIWAGSDNNIYIVGDQGTTVSYFAGMWHGIQSGTTLDIQDIWGVSNSTTGQSEILAVACDEFKNDGLSVLQLSGTQATMVRTSGLPTTNLVGIWSPNRREWYICGASLFHSRSLNSPWQQVNGLPSIYMEAIRGNGPNDIFVVGDFGLVLHWNGEFWHDFTGNELPYIQGSYLAVAVKGNIVVAVGYLGGQVGNQPAVALIGKRN